MTKKLQKLLPNQQFLQSKTIFLLWKNFIKPFLNIFQGRNLRSDIMIQTIAKIVSNVEKVSILYKDRRSHIDIKSLFNPMRQKIIPHFLAKSLIKKSDLHPYVVTSTTPYRLPRSYRTSRLKFIGNFCIISLSFICNS